MPTQLSFPVTRAHQLLPTPSPAGPFRLPGPRPGPAQVTRVSRLRPCFLTPCLFGCSAEEAVLFDFPRKNSSFPFPTSCTRSHTPKKGRSSPFHPPCRLLFFLLFVSQCSSSKYRSTETRRRYQESTSVLEIALEQLFPPPPLLCTFLGSLHLLQCRPQRPSSKHRCAHRSASIRAYYLIFPTIQKLKSIFLP